jgi:hypothetical protein
MTTRSIVLKELIARDRSHDDAALFEQCHVSDVDAVATIGAEILDHTPVFHGACASMSAAWAALLSDRLELPAVAVAGDLMIGGFTISFAIGICPMQHPVHRCRCGTVIVGSRSMAGSVIFQYSGPPVLSIDRAG